MHSIRDILQKKGTVVWSTSPNETVLEAIRRMAEHDVGALLVMEGEELAGFSTGSCEPLLGLQELGLCRAQLRAVHGHQVVTLSHPNAGVVDEEPIETASDPLGLP